MMQKFKVIYPFCGIGGFALGLQDVHMKHAGLDGEFETLVGIDNDEGACADFRLLTGARAVCADLGTMTIDEMRSACLGSAPDVVVSSPPCKGNSRLISDEMAQTEKYEAMNRLVFQGLFLILEAFRSQPPKLIVIENVPGITHKNRGLRWLEKLRPFLSNYGYRIHEGTHDCGELGGLAQHRKRYLMLARHERQMPAFVYRTPKLRVRAIGEVIGPLWLPDDPRGGPMHRLSRLQWKTWVRLALIRAGYDWRDLGTRNDGKKPYNNVFRIVPWNLPSVAITGGQSPTSGGVNVADPRFDNAPGLFGNHYRVERWDGPAPTITTATRPVEGAISVADPRLDPNVKWHNGAYGVLGFDQASGTVTGNGRPAAGSFSVADPRFTHSKQAHEHKFRVERWDRPAHAVTGADRVGSGAPSVSDPRLGTWNPEIGDSSKTKWANRSSQGLLGVLDWAGPAKTISASAQVSGSNCPVSVADPRIPEDSDMPNPPPVIIALDGTWHRPLTTLELAAIQGFPVVNADGSPLILSGKAHTAWRERVGNAVPPPAAKAIGQEIMKALLMSVSGRTFSLNSTDVWVQEEGICAL